MNKKNKAKLAFEFASKLDFDPQIKENALFNYAKITFQLRNTPFNDAINAFKTYIDQYPDSDNIEEAYNYLVKAYLNSNNYKDALESLEKVESMDVRLEKAYQKVAYFRGLELYNNLHYEESIQILKKSLRFDQYDKEIAALATYWRAEASYQLENYNEAGKYYQEFLMLPGAYGTNVYDKAHYNLGYTYFQQEDYPEAIKWFRKFLNLSNEEQNKHQADTYIRLGDCYFIRRSYWLAIDYYDKAIELDVWDQDYALFQRAFALGLLERPEKKIASLKQLTEQYTESGYIDNAYYELGQSYMNLNQTDNAIPYYNRVVNEYPSSSYVKKSLVQLGLIYYNRNENDQAINYYKRVVAEYPGSSEAKNALTGLKNIYVDKNQVDKYFAYVGGLGDFARVSISEQDSLTYISAEKVYMQQDCENAIEFFKKYLQKFNNGNFAMNAHFYMGDCYYRQDEPDKALEHFEHVINRPENAFTEQALTIASDIKYKKGAYKEALELYKELEKVAEVRLNLLQSRIGQMRIHFQMEEFTKAIEAADRVLHTEKVNDRQKREAHYIKGKSLYLTESYKPAMKELRLIADEVNSKEGAEAKYLIASIYLKQNEYQVAENEVFDFVQQNSSQEYWKARSFILLAEVYRAMEDNFQAKHTLKSIIENYESGEDGDDIIQMAKEKYNQIVEEEKYQMKGDTIEDEMKIQFENVKEKEQKNANSDSTQFEM
jgi:TolA-binding protein